MPRSSASRSPSSPRRSSSRDRKDSRSPSRRRSASRSPRSPRGRRSRSGPRRSRSPPRRPRYSGYDNKTNAPPNRCIGVFGLSLSTKEDTLIRLFDRYPGFESVKLVKEFGSGRSRGFAFITFESKDDAAYAREKCNGHEVEGHPIRIDFSANEMRRGPFRGGRSPPRYRRRSRSRSYERRRSISRSPRRR
ncbi:transformer-2 protein homolog beta-like isoform X2 [Convolutriloba macropyga]|uniref:transformer-2 protein homolog beta-like isoform X2 n=1 Tax=Convolutriloba macropyga TaxID=536237 RepID=UPI003F51BFEB